MGRQAPERAGRLTRLRGDTALARAAVCRSLPPLQLVKGRGCSSRSPLRLPEQPAKLRAALPMHLPLFSPAGSGSASGGLRRARRTASRRASSRVTATATSLRRSRWAWPRWAPLLGWPAGTPRGGGAAARHAAGLSYAAPLRCSRHAPLCLAGIFLLPCCQLRLSPALLLTPCPPVCPCRRSPVARPCTTSGCSTRTRGWAGPAWAPRTRTTSTTSRSSPTARSCSSTRWGGAAVPRLLLPGNHRLGARAASPEQVWLDASHAEGGRGLPLIKLRPRSPRLPPHLGGHWPAEPAGRRRVRRRCWRGRCQHNSLQAGQGLLRCRLRQGRRGRRGAGGR